MTKITITGRATADATLKFTPSGAAVASFSLADNHRKKNAQTGEWEDDGATFYNVQAWQHLAEECAEHVRKGRIVTVVGDVRLRQYEGRDGTKGQSLDVRADEVALCLSKFPPRDGQPRQSAPAAQSWQAPAGDPWAVGGRDEAAPF